ncbi:hypothetical protein [Streptomyces venezuelae]|uniref:hypothetical protein n=1 Tax=Streptomyces venezuelae TaxID=54571 RepID=UPI00362822CB
MEPSDEEGFEVIENVVLALNAGPTRGGVKVAGGLRFSWELVGVGGAMYRIGDGASEHEAHVGYCTDALADLLYAMTGLYGGSSGERFSFDCEPMEVRWLLRRQGADVGIAVFEFPDGGTTWGSSDETGGVLLWSSTQPRTVLCHAVMEAAETVLREHGEDGYQEMWMMHPFPVAALQDLRRMHRRSDDCRHPQCRPAPATGG